MSFELSGSYGTIVILLSAVSALSFLLSAWLDSKVRAAALRLCVVFTWAPLTYSVASRTVGLGLVLVWPGALLLGLWILGTTFIVQASPRIAAGAAVPFLIAAAVVLLLSVDNPYDSAAGRLHGHVALICVAAVNFAAAFSFLVNAFRRPQPEPRAAAQPAFVPTQGA